MDNSNKKIKFLPLPYIGMFDLDLIYQTSDVELLYQILYKVNKIVQSQNIIIEDFQKILEWATSQIEKYTKEQLQTWLDDGTLVEAIKPYVDTLIEMKQDKVTTYKEIKNNDITINDVLECALSYYYNNDKLFYDNNTALNDTIDSDGTRLAIDCSTFVCLVLNGVKYETSRYSLGGDKYNNIPDYRYATNIYDNGSAMFRRYANMMGKYFYDMGLAFTPNNDFTNLRTGDLIFWQGEPTPGAFMDISHVAIFLNLTVDNRVRYIDANTGRENVISIASSLIDDDFRNTICLCARPDYNAINYILSQNIVNGNQEHTIQNTAGINYNTLSPLEKGFYTIIIKGTGDAPSVSSNGSSLACTPILNDLYIAYLRLETVSNNNIKVYVSNNTKTFNLEWVCVYKRFIENPYPFYVAPTIRGNRGKIRLSAEKTFSASASAYQLVKFDEIVGNNFNGIFNLSKDGCITIEETGQYLVNIGIANKSNAFANYRAISMPQGGSAITQLSMSNIIGVSGHNTYSHMTFGGVFNAGQRIGLQINNTSDITLLAGSFNTYIEVIKL